MSHSTTATSTYILGKYSRSYPSNAATKQLSGDMVQSDWQHFTNPIIRLYLDITKARNGELESARLRIKWKIDSGDACASASVTEVDFEDLELLSFASFASRTAQIYHGQGLPLKAVYRDTVVGVRYLHSTTRDSISTTDYRRFQISFLDSSAVLEFINLISSVCPCKATPPITQGPSAPVPTSTNIQIAQAASTLSNNQANAVASSSQRQTQTQQPLVTHSGHMAISAPVYRPSPLQTGHPSRTGAPMLTPSIPFQNGDIPSSDLGFSFTSPMGKVSSPPGLELSSQTFQTSSSQLYHDASRSHHPYPIDSTLQIRQPQTHNRTAHNTENTDLNLQQDLLQSPQASSNEMHDKHVLPASSLPPSAGSSVGGINQLKDTQIVSTTHRPLTVSLDTDQILSALRDATALYNLSSSDLESIVGDVVREDGFAQLMENLDKLWRLKVLVGR